MQIFMPYPDLEKSVRCLDPSRLGNQVWREAKTLLNGGWSNHPAAKMWAPYKPALAAYCIYGLDELYQRQHIEQKKSASLREYFITFIGKTNWIIDNYDIPPFIGNEEYHRSHRLNLLFKNPEWYSKYFDEPAPTQKPEYVWPLTK